MADLVEVLIEDPRWAALGLDAIAQQACRATLGHLGLSAGGVTIDLMGCDDRRIMVLNADFRGKPKATNVLSWPSQDRASGVAGQAPDLPVGDPDDPHELGDIAVAYDTCAREASEAGKDIRHHVAHLLVHGVLHLLGYDHIDGQDAALMEGIEQQVLASMGHPDPYGDCTV